MAACRNPGAATELCSLRESDEGRLHIIELDVAQEQSVKTAAHTVRALSDKIDLLLNVAGTKGNVPGFTPDKNLSRTLGEIEASSMAEIFATNAIGPLLIVQALAPILGGATVVNVTSSMGSNGLMNRGDWYAYRASKAALNIVSHALSFDLRDGRTIVVAMHPGWVKTAMGTEGAPYPLVESVTSLLGVIGGLTFEDSGRFLNWKGDELPW
jgi:NAD(P)-dependent dehydrogenase (short-subunit alcohol dehydrogenase family)